MSQRNLIKGTTVMPTSRKGFPLLQRACSCSLAGGRQACVK